MADKEKKQAAVKSKLHKKKIKKTIISIILIGCITVIVVFNVNGNVVNVLGIFHQLENYQSKM